MTDLRIATPVQVAYPARGRCRESLELKKYLEKEWKFSAVGSRSLRGFCMGNGPAGEKNSLDRPEPVQYRTMLRSWVAGIASLFCIFLRRKT